MNKYISPIKREEEVTIIELVDKINEIIESVNELNKNKKWKN